MSGESVVRTERVARVRRGDTDALAAAFDEYRPRLLKTATFRLNPRLLGRVDPEDVLQEAYLNAAQRCAHVEGDTEQSLFIWLRLVVAQTLIDIHRRHLGAEMRDAGREVSLRAQFSSDETTVTLAHNLLANITSPSLALRRIELSERLRAAIDGMDPIDREVLLLRHFEELTNQEISAVLDLDRKAASIRYFRALRRLKAILEETGGFDSLAAMP
ncbi:MAG: sigma-70 family RNA polymerase sigma factor [Phycisphaerae bacterium]|nr:sigma-70 family RNA polymerase sigma factor [Phycisphaerae bacterium]